MGKTCLKFPISRLNDFQVRAQKCYSWMDGQIGWIDVQKGRHSGKTRINTPPPPPPPPPHIPSLYLVSLLYIWGFLTHQQQTAFEKKQAISSFPTMFSTQSDSGIPICLFFNIISSFAAELEEPKIRK